MMLAGALLLSAASAQAVTLPMFKQQESDTVTISREEYESYQRYQKLEMLLQLVETYYYEDVDEDAMLENAAVGLMAGIGDILGALLFPSGAYFPGFTLTAVLTAACTAFFIHKNATLLRVTLSVIINQLFGSVLLNSLWISVLYGKGYIALLPGRIIQAGIMTVLQIVLTFLLFGEKSPIRQRLSKFFNV